MYTGLKAGVNEKRAGARCQRRARGDRRYTHLNASVFRNRARANSAKTIVIDLRPASAALRLRRGIQYRSDVTAAFNQKDLRVRLELVTGVWKIRV